MPPVQPVRYFDGQALTAADFQQEQLFLLSAQRRHTLALHGWGLVDGFTLEVDGDVFVDAGFAVDGYGRDVVLVERTLLNVTLKDIQSRRLDGVAVWVSYDRQAAGPDRWSDAPRLWQVPVRSGGARASPPPASAPGHPFDLWEDAPDDPGASWPIYLGFVGPDPLDHSRLLADLGGRRFIGAVAHEVSSPDGAARLRLGSAGEGDDTCLALWGGGDQAGPPSFRLHRSGDLDTPGRLSAAGLALSGPVEFSADAPEPQDSAFRVYRATGENGPELRVELASGGKFEIGAWSADGKTFTPALTVAGDGGVKVAGDLAVGGHIEPPPSASAQALSPEAAAAIKAATVALATQNALRAAAPPAPIPPVALGHPGGTATVPATAQEAGAPVTPSPAPPPAAPSFLKKTLGFLGKVLAAPLKLIALPLNALIRLLDPAVAKPANGPAPPGPGP